MRKLSDEDYTIFNGRKFFYVSADMSIQCAHCLFVQERTFVRNKDGLIIGVMLLEENEQHSDDCKQNVVQ